MLWYRFRSRRRLWSVWRGGPKEHPEFGIERGGFAAPSLIDGSEAMAGVTCTVNAEVYINSDVHESIDEEDETVLHEMMHVAYESAPAEMKMSTQETVEKVIRAMSPRLWPILKARGLRWPARRGAK